MRIFFVIKHELAELADDGGKQGVDKKLRRRQVIYVADRLPIARIASLAW
jgi:hypothetical protein